MQQLTAAVLFLSTMTQAAQENATFKWEIALKHAPTPEFTLRREQRHMTHDEAELASLNPPDKTSRCSMPLTDLYKKLKTPQSNIAKPNKAFADRVAASADTQKRTKSK